MLHKTVSDEYWCGGDFYEFSINAEKKGGFFAEYYANDNSIYIRGVHILEGQENQGYGTQMMQEAVAVLHNEYPNAPIFLTVRGDNYSAIKIYTKTGFIPQQPVYSKINPLLDITMIFNDINISTIINKEILIGKKIIREYGSKRAKRLYKILFSKNIEEYIKEYKKILMKKYI